MKVEFTKAEIEQAIKVCSFSKKSTVVTGWSKALISDPDKAAAHVNSLVNLFIKGNDLTSLIGADGNRLIHQLAFTIVKAVDKAVSQDLLHNVIPGKYEN